MNAHIQRVNGEIVNVKSDKVIGTLDSMKITDKHHSLNIIGSEDDGGYMRTYLLVGHTCTPSVSFNRKLEQFLIALCVSNTN